MATLYPIARPQQTPPQADIVFVHGLNPLGKLRRNHAFWTWGGTDKDNPGWPSQLAAELPNTQIWIVEYDASAFHLTNAQTGLASEAQELLRKFYAEGITKRPLILIGHSLGGLLIKQALKSAEDGSNQEWKPIYNNTQAVVFFGTPHAGARLATVLMWFGCISRAGSLVNLLQQHDDRLAELNRFYRRHVHSKPIRTYAFGEKRTTCFVMVVDRTSADPGVLERPLAMVTANHFDLARMKSKDNVFSEVRVFIEDTLKKNVTPLQQLPIKASSEFTGREVELARLHEILTSGDAALTQPPALSGWGGVGKTQLAAKYAEVYGNEHTGGVFWVRADATETLWESFLSIARQCAKECIVEEEPWTTALKVCDWLSERKGALIVFDNADTPEVTEQYRERLGQAVRVLLTTRALSIAGCTMVPIETFEPKDGADLILKRAGLELTNANAQAVARTLSERLGGLALALDQAGRFIHGGGINALKEYITSFDAEKIFLLGQRTEQQQKPEKTREYEEHVSVLTTYTLAMKRLEDTKELAAMQLVRLLAYLAPEGTEDALLHAGAEALEEPLKTVIASPMRWRAMVKAAARLGLLQSEEVQSGEDNTIRFLTQHRLTREVAKELLTPEEQAVFVQQAVNVVRAVTPNILQTRWWEKSPLWPQWTEIVQVIQKANVVTVESSYLLNAIATWWQYTGRYQDAEPLHRQALDINKAVHGDEHPTVVTSLNNLALLLKATGRYQDAELLYRQALDIDKAVHGDEHPTVAISLNNLAGLLEATGRYQDAEPLYRQALAIRRRQLGDEHPTVAISLNNLAVLLRTTGRYQDAEPLFQQALGILKTVHGDEHPDVAASLDNLAGLLEATGRYQDAEPLYRQALAIRRRQLGDEHPDVATSLNNLALLLEATGHYQDAELLLRQALDINKAVHGDEHPDIATSLNNLAELLEATGHYQDAELLYRQAIGIDKAVHGENHPNTVIRYANLGDLLVSTGRLTEGLPMLKHATQVMKVHFPAEHPWVQGTQALLNEALDIQKAEG